MGKLHDALKAVGYEGKPLEVYLVRLLFCLFADSLPSAQFDTKMREALLDLCALDWSLIYPAIFGSLFQSIIDANARRNLGAHYTSEEKIFQAD
jgi:hypothetical protein